MELKDLMKYFVLAIVACACVSGPLYAADDADDDQEEVSAKKKSRKAKGNRRRAPSPMRPFLVIGRFENKSGVRHVSRAKLMSEKRK